MTESFPICTSSRTPRCPLMYFSLILDNHYFRPPSPTHHHPPSLSALPSCPLIVPLFMYKYVGCASFHRRPPFSLHSLKNLSSESASLFQFVRSPSSTTSFSFSLLHLTRHRCSGSESAEWLRVAHRSSVPSCFRSSHPCSPHILSVLASSSF